MNFDYDIVGNLTALTTPAGITHRFRYDAIHQPTGYDAPASGTDWHYDRDRYLIGVTRPGGESLTLTRDIAGRVTRLAHGAGQIDYGYDAFGRIESVDAGTNRLQYLRTGSLITGTEWQGEVSGQVKSLLGRVFPLPAPTELIDAGGDHLLLNYTHDAAGRPTTVKLGEHTLVTGYAAHGAVAAAAVSVGPAPPQYRFERQFNDFGENIHDAYTGPYVMPHAQAMRSAFIATAYALKSELLAEVQNQGTCARRGWFIRDPRGGSVGEVGDGDVMPSMGPAWLYEDTLDAAFREELTASFGPSQSRSPDFCTEWINDVIDGVVSMAGYVSSDWDSHIGLFLNELKLDVQGGAAAITAHDVEAPPLTDTTSYLTSAAAAYFAELESLRTKVVANTPDLGFIAQYRYARDALGRIASRTETILGTQREHRYTYDLAGRLTAHDVDGVRTEWTFDANGNRTHENGTEIARYDSEDRLTAWRDNNYTYTPAGDLQSRTNPSGTTTYTYDALGSLHQVTLPGGTRIDYVIDPQGRRIGKKKNGALQYGLLYQDALNPIAELGPDGRIKSVFLYAEHAHAPAAMVRDGKLYRFVTDHLGSIRVVIDTETGTIAQQLDYDVWGKVTLDTQPGFQPFGFAGGVYDADTGLTRFGARDYDGETGRWTAKDPILFAGGDTNLYGYVLQDPVNWVDPRGLAPDDVFPSQDAAALDAGNYARTFPKQGIEYGGWIYPKDNGFTYNITPGTPFSVPAERLDKIKPECPSAGWHTHPNPGYNNPRQETFSEKDLKSANDRQLPLYLKAPMGSTLRYDPATGKTSTVR